MVCDKHFCPLEKKIYNFLKNIFQPGNSKRFAPIWGTDFSRFNEI